MSRIPDYKQMRVMLATAEAENIDGNDLVDLLLDGCKGYFNERDEDILKEFIDTHGEHKIPKMPLTKDDYNKMALRNEDKRIERGDPR
tara:strand:+ start:1621 stop:1884 length:264 start_codon:yes stop_codon:yes gene_type:complete